MAKATRVETSKKKEGKRYICLVTSDSCDIKLKHKDLEGLTEVQMQNLIQSYCGTMSVFVHINDDDSVAVAIGVMPDLWPEDV